MKGRNKLLLLLLLLLIAGASYLYYINRNYISTLQSVVSEGINTANYKELSEIIKKLPITKKIFSVDQYSSLYGNDRVGKMHKIDDSVAINLDFIKDDDDPSKRSAVIYFNLPAEMNMEDGILAGVG